MRFSYSYFLICLALIVCLQSALAAPQDAVRRQDDSPSEDSPASTTREAASSQRPTATPTLTPTPSEAASSSIESSPPSSTAPSSTKPSEPASTPTQVPSTEPAPKPAPSSSPDKNANPLPIPPTLTPAMGISGVILLLSGLTYGIVGIKKRMIYVFGSAAYLTALAVTVLIVYLMNPPVSNAIQGAFFVAAFFTGAIFGALSLVFVDITEGFGCLLGGFCLSMWFLSLKDGGLISSGAGRAIFIGCMSAGGYCLSFSRYTRNYGLIGSIAFSGATAAILGIDCLAGAGWKEFWLYLWDLNDSIFPLDTNTYPVTRNMKAELAGVVIIAVAGIISQLRVWKMVKEHRAKDAAQQLERQQDLDREEEERGRMIEDELQKERAQWEAAYGGKSLPESSPRSSMASPKGSTSVEEKELHSTDNLEMATHGGVAPSVGANKSSGGMVTVSVLQDDDIQQIDAHGNPIVHDNSVVVPEVESEKSLPDTPQVPQPALIRKDSRPTPPPAVVPLPFTIPKEETDQNDDDNASVSAIPETEPDVSERPQVSKRVSDVSAMRQRISRDMAVSQEALLQDLHVEDDRASSVAATLDNDNDMMSVRELSPVQSPIGLEERKDPFDDVVPAKSADDADVAKEQNTVPDQANHSLVVTPQSPTTSASATSEEQGGKSSDAQDEARADTVVSSSKDSSVDRHSKAAHSDALSLGSQAEKAGQRVSVLRDGALPDTLSKVALSYRTNEWAKHLEAAEKPDYEDIFMPSSSSVLLPNGVEEKPAPVSEELVAPLMESRRSSKRISSGSRMQRNSIGVERTSLTLSQESLVDPRFSTRSPPAAVLSRANSRSQGDVLAPLPTNTLLSKRENLIKNRASALMLSPHSSSTTLLGDHADEEDMTLAQRRQLLQRQSISPDPAYESPLTSPRRAPPSASQKWQSKGWAGSGAPAGFDSHQPQRTNSAQSNNKREQLYAGWRDSIRDVTPQSTTYILEQQRAALLQERRQKEMAKQQRELVQQQRASQMDSMMRSGQMLDAHREAMRRMQANANKHA